MTHASPQPPGEAPPLPPLPHARVVAARTTDACAAARLAGSGLAWRTVFVLVYAGAVVGTSRWLRPSQVSRMTDDQARLATPAARAAWLRDSSTPGYEAGPGRWYAENTRESIRAVLRDVLLPTGAVVERTGLAPTSSAARWALTPGFCDYLTSTGPAPWSPPELPHRSGVAAVVRTYRAAITASEGFARRTPASDPRCSAVSRAATALQEALRVLTAP